MNKNNVLYQVSSHWDREWYMQFQGFRFYLEKMISKLLDDLDSGKIPYFNLDGQTIVLEDYLEICPHNRERIEKHIKEGRLTIGPWYVMPDELLVSGESLIHNLLTGEAVAKEFNTTTHKFGYINDVFGHIAQMPQIFNGFGIDSVYLGRGVGNKEADYTNFLWYSPDGSKCYSCKQVYSRLKKTFENSDDKAKVLRDALTPSDPQVPVTVLNYTNDHTFTDENTYEFCQMLENTDDANVVKGIDKLSEFLKPYEDKLPTEKGELIRTAQTSKDFSAVTHSISSYYPLKRDNDICENMIYSVLAPVMVMSDIWNIDILKNYYHLACRYLLKNQPHDSICGCSIDKVHKDMLYRYSQVKAIGDVVTSYFNNSIKSENPDGTLKLTVMNFDIHKKAMPVIAKIVFPSDWESVYENKPYYKKINTFSIVDADKNNIAYQILKIDRNVPEYNMQEERLTDIYTVAFPAKLNAFGATDYYIEPAEKPAIYPKEFSDIKLGAENKHLIFAINPDGSVNLTDKKTGKTYENLNTFTDDGDCGNGWFYTKTEFGESIVNSQGSPCTIETVHQGPVFYSYRITKLMTVPKTVNYDDYSRSPETVELKIVTEVSLNGDDDKLVFNTTVYNNAESHRLRVHFPTEIAGETYKTSQAFAFTQRLRGVTQRGITSFEPEPYEKSTGGIVGVEGADASLSFIGINGLHEAGVSKDGTISVTLFRSVGKMFHETNPENCQLQGEMNFEYALTFENRNASLLNMQRDMANPPYCITSENGNSKSASLIDCDNPDIVLSIVKPSADGDNIVLRVYNPDDCCKTGKITLNFDFKNIYEAFMSEEVKEKCNAKDNKIDISLKPYEIKTYTINKG